MSGAALPRERPGAPAPECTVAGILDAVDAVVYADLFGCAADLDAIHRFARRRLEIGELEDLLAELVERGVFARRYDVYCLAGNEGNLDEFDASRSRARRLARRARVVCRVLQHLPYVRGLALTGSAAAGQAHREADIDLLVVVERRRMATVFVLCGGLSRLLGRGVLCPNYYLADGPLTLERRTHFVAREILQTRPVTGVAHRLAPDNGWVGERLPNAEVRPLGAPRDRRGSFLQSLQEAILGGSWGERLEVRLAATVERRLERHYRERLGAVPSVVAEKWRRRAELRFHGARRMVGVMDRYRQRRRRLARLLVEEGIAAAEPDALEPGRKAPARSVESVSEPG